MRAADVPLFTLSVRLQYECALACAYQYAYLAHPLSFLPDSRVVTLYRRLKQLKIDIPAQKIHGAAALLPYGGPATHENMTVHSAFGLRCANPSRTKSLRMTCLRWFKSAALSYLQRPVQRRRDYPLSVRGHRNAQNGTR